MTFDRFYGLLRDAVEFCSEDQFVGEVGYPEDISMDADSFLKVLHIIYTAANGSFKELVAGHKLVGISRGYGMPYRTLQDWASADRTPPEYVKYLLAFAMISDLAG